MERKLSERAHRRLLEQAAELGREAGTNAASWWEQDAIGGRVTNGSERETAKLAIQGIEDCDPLILDTLPCPDLSGQWAGDPTPATLAEGLDFDPEAYEDGPEVLDDLCREWEDAARGAVELEIVRLCHEVLS